VEKGPVIFERKGITAGAFEAKSLLDPGAHTEPRVQPRNPPARQPQFLAARNFFRTSWWSRLGTILSRYPSHLTLISNKFFRDIPVLPNRFAGRQIGVSIVLHAGAFCSCPFCCAICLR